jgi:hypothetical protein
VGYVLDFRLPARIKGRSPPHVQKIKAKSSSYESITIQISKNLYYAIAVNQGIAKITMEEHDRKRRRDELQSQLQQHLDSQQEEAEYDQQLQDEMHAMATIAYSMTVDDDTSEEEDDKPKWGGSRPGKAPNKNRDFKAAHANLKKHYFNGVDSVYDETDFERRFRMPRSVFMRLHDQLTGMDPFVDKADALDKSGVAPLVRMVAALRMLAYGTAADGLDENLQISETVTLDAMKAFCKLVVQEFGPDYLNRCPTKEEKEHAIKLMESRGFPGCFSSWDCKHFNWAKCTIHLLGRRQPSYQAQAL